MLMYNWYSIVIYIHKTWTFPFMCGNKITINLVLLPLNCTIMRKNVPVF